MHYEPDWEPVRWDLQFGSLDFYLNRPLPGSFARSFPPAQAPGPSAGDIGGAADYTV